MMRPLASLAVNTARRAAVARTSVFAVQTASQSAVRRTAVRALATSAVPGQTDDFLKGASAAVLESLYESWRLDTKSVDPKWDEYFNALEQYQFTQKGPLAAAGEAVSAQPTTVTPKMLDEHKKVLELVRSYRVFGHLSANLDPLGLWNRPPYQELDYRFWGFTDADLSRKFYVGAPLAPADGWLTLGEIVDKLKYTYASTLGVEYMHVQDVERKNWIEKKLEHRKREFTQKQHWVILNWLTWAHWFEGYLAKKYPFTKRFGLEGAEALIPCIEGLIERASSLGMDSAVIGMAHRGRLNVLANVLKKPMYKMFAEFEDKKGLQARDQVEGSGDVMYHLGTSTDRVMFNGKEVHLTLVANPSHLEASDPVVEGKTRAKQFWSEDYMHENTMAILVHGDAAFSGQGVVAETLGMSDLPDYTTGGTIHIVVNNQIGFTTNPKFSRSSPYPTDIAKGLQCPILHVNGDDPEAVVWAAETAAEYRQMFKKSVVIDIFCYRKQGHNEMDEPMFTQPIMYKKIAKHQPTLELYRQRLLNDGILDAAEIAAVEKRYLDLCEEQYSKSSDAQYEPPGEWLKDAWKTMLKPSQLAARLETGVSVDTLRELGMKFTDIPPTHRPHRKIAQLYQQRRAAIERGTGLDWAMGEQLAFSSLLHEGYHVRLSGQDSERGTFSHRHSVVYDQETEARHIPLANINRKPSGMSLFNVSNSSLSEYGVLGFEYGYSLENPNALVMWEAQFGDFANGAQIIVDQFLSSAEHKWYRQSGLVMMLPHGYEGQGPEHSSARLERYLQLVNEEPNKFPEYEALDAQTVSKNMMKLTQAVNYCVAVPTTPANLFHLMRRQVHRMFRKPLILITPKSLLKAPYCVSDLEDFGEHTRVSNIIPEVSPEKLLPDNEIKRIIFCTGKVYYDLAKARDINAVKDTAIIRIEQLAPFPFHHILIELRRYPNAEITWCQEEPRNQGAFTFVRPRLKLCYQEARGETKEIRYTGRKPAASPATGSKRVHYAELEAFLADAFEAKDDPAWKPLDSH